MAWTKTSAEIEKSEQRGRPSIKKQENRQILFFILIMALLALGMSIIGYFSYSSYARQYRVRLEEQLNAVAELKVSEITSWYRERVGDGEVIKENPVMVDLVKDFIMNPQNEGMENKLLHSMEIVRGIYNYDAVLLVNRAGDILASTPKIEEDHLESHLAEQAARSFLTGTVQFIDFHIHDQAEYGEIYLAVVVPLSDPSESEKPLGAIFLRIDANDYLYPLLSFWPTDSPTAETLLVRKDGSEVLFLNPLRFQSDAALQLRFPLTDDDLLTVKAVKGQEGVTEGRDYRNKDAIGVINEIPDLPWHLIARMDLDEIYVSLYERLWQTILFFGALYLAAGMALLLLWRQQLLQLYRVRVTSAEALKESEEFNRMVMDHLPIGLAINTVSPGVIFTYMNENFYKIYRVDKKDLVKNDSFWEAVYEEPDYREKIKANVLAAHESGDERLMQWTEIPIVRQGETIAYINAANTKIPGKNLVISMVWDITKQKKAQDELRANYKLLHLAGEIARFGGWSYDIKADSLYWSDEVAAIHDRPAGYVPTLEEGINYYTARCRDKIKEVFSACITRGEPYDEEMEIITALDKHLWVRAIGMAVYDNDGNIIAVQGAFQDISRQKSAEEEIMRLNRILEQRVRERTTELEAANRELESFAYSVSHDLRAPLRALSGFSELLIEQYSDRLDREGVHYLTRISSASKKMGELIDGLLKLTRVSRAELSYEMVDLTALAEEFLAGFREHEPLRKVSWIIKPGLAVRADRSLIETALGNMLANAWKFSGKKEHAIIEVTSEIREDEEIFIIRDNGAGFDGAYSGKLFLPFQRLHGSDEFSGTGIGLATVQRVISRHGGRIWAESTVGGGATFYFTLGK